MKKVILTSLVLILYICSFGQTNLQWGYTPLHDSIFFDTDTLYQTNIDISNNDQFTYVYGVDYGDIDSNTILLYIQASIPSYGWTTISDTIVIDSTTTGRAKYLTGTTPPYPEMKFIIESDAVGDTIEGWVKDILYTKKTN